MTRPFDEEAAKAGAPVQTKDGRKVRILCYDRACKLFPIVGLVTELDGAEPCYSWTPQGSIDLSWADKSDLVMAPIKKEGWINLSPGKEPIVGGPVYATKEEAKARTSPHIIQVHIEWEE